MTPDARQKLDALPPKRRSFVLFYTGECQGNAAESYRRAGYKCKTDRVAEVEGHKLLSNPEVAAAIEALSRPAEDALIATREERQRVLTAIIRGEDGGRTVKDFATGDSHEEGPQARDRLRAIELLGKMQGDFIEKHEHSGPGGKPIQAEVELANAEYEKTMRRLFDAKGDPDADS